MRIPGSHSRPESDSKIPQPSNKTNPQKTESLKKITDEGVIKEGKKTDSSKKQYTH